MLTELIAAAREDEAYLESVLDELSRAECDRDLADIRRELVNAGYIKEKTQGKRQKHRSGESRCGSYPTAARRSLSAAATCRTMSSRSILPAAPIYGRMCRSSRKPCDRVAGGGRGGRGNDPAGRGARRNIFAGEKPAVGG